jgi:hypothetical protein
MEDTALQSTPAELGEESLDGVEPGARGWCEVEDETHTKVQNKPDPANAGTKHLVDGI